MPDGQELYTSGIVTLCSNPDCGREFRVVVSYEPRYRKGKPSGSVVSFGCPHCGTRWNAAYVTQRGLVVREQLAAARKRQREHPSESNERDVTRLAQRMEAETRPLAAASRARTDG